jgi:hypothetical protein
VVTALSRRDEAALVPHGEQLVAPQQVAIVTSDDGAACSLLASLQGRAAATEVFFTLEPLGGGTGPAVEPMVTAIAALLVGPSPMTC